MSDRVKRLNLVVTYRPEFAEDQRYEVTISFTHPSQRDPWDEVVAAGSGRGPCEAAQRALARVSDEHLRRPEWGDDDG